jgi:hypothetical protein
MERATSLVVLTGFFQMNTTVDKLDNIGAIQQIINKRLRDFASHLNSVCQ